MNSEESFTESGQPCSVPVFNIYVVETALPIFTTCGRPRRKFKSQLHSLSGIFRSFGEYFTWDDSFEGRTVVDNENSSVRIFYSLSD